MMNVLMGLALVAKKPSTDDERAEGPSSSSKEAQR